MWTRSVLCRLCECPVSDGGVRVDQLDAAKLSEWWLRKLGTDFIPEESEVKEVFCNFCIWDARLEHEYSVKESNWLVDVDWWSGHDTNLFFCKYYYQEEAILRPCRVDLGPNINTKANDIKKRHQRVQTSYGNPVCNDQLDDKEKQKDLKAQHRCMLCNRAYNKNSNMVQHMLKKHAGLFILCKHNGKCGKIFRTEAEKSEHLLELIVRNSEGKLMNCDFCCRMYPKIDKGRHFKIHHKNLIRCSYNNCSIHFLSEGEKQNHEALVHASTGKSKCIFCNLFFRAHTMLPHLKKMHKSLLPSAFKCKYKCKRYFLTVAELNEHIASVHNKCMLRKEVQCIYCNKICIDNKALNAHINCNHSVVKIRCKYHHCIQCFHTQNQADEHFEQQHLKIENNKKFECSKCNYRTARNYTLKIHISQMHGDSSMSRPCPKCSRRFSSSAAFKEHIRQVHWPKKVCPHCDQRYNRNRAHLKQQKCKRCHKVLLCVLTARLHKKLCNLQTDPGLVNVR